MMGETSESRATSADDHVRSLVVGGQIPVRFDLATADLAGPIAPAPIYVSIAADL